MPSVDLYLAGFAVIVGLISGRDIPIHPLRSGHARRRRQRTWRAADRALGHAAERRQLGASRPCWRPRPGILILPITTLSPSDYTLFIVPALGAALLARFTSFPVTVAAGLAIGMLQSELGKLQTVWTWLPQSGLQDGLPFILIMIAVVAAVQAAAGAR